MPSTYTSKGGTWDALRVRVLDRDNWTCQYCGKHLEGADATADHITAKVNGGVDAEWNLVAACRTCNGIKSGHALVRMPWYNPRYLSSLPL